MCNSRWIWYYEGYLISNMGLITALVACYKVINILFLLLVEKLRFFLCDLKVHNSTADSAAKHAEASQRRCAIWTLSGFKFSSIDFLSVVYRMSTRRHQLNWHTTLTVWRLLMGCDLNNKRVSPGADVLNRSRKIQLATAADATWTDWRETNTITRMRRLAASAGWPPQ